MSEIFSYQSRYFVYEPMYGFIHFYILYAVNLSMTFVLMNILNPAMSLDTYFKKIRAIIERKKGVIFFFFVKNL